MNARPSSQAEPSFGSESNRPGPARFPLPKGPALAFLLALALDFGSASGLLGQIFPIPMTAALALYLSAFAAHECGHLIGGRLAGFRFVLFSVGPLEISRRGEHRSRPQVRFNWRRQMSGGMSSSVPVDAHDLRRRNLVMLAGGPLASLALGLAGGAALFFGSTATGGAVAFGDSVAFALKLICGLSLLIFVASAVPTSFSDGGRMVKLLRGGPRAERWCVLGALYGMSQGMGQRPREWDTELSEKVEALSDGSFEGVVATMLAYYRALDKGEVEEAGAFLDRGLAARKAWPSLLRPGITLEGAYFESRYRQNTSAARTWLDEAQRAHGSPTVERQSRLRAEAAVLLAESKAQEAQAMAKEGLTAVKDTANVGLAQAEAEWLQEIVTLAQSRRAEA